MDEKERQQINSYLCDALGLDVNLIESIEIRVRPGELPRAIVVQRLSGEIGYAVSRILKPYRWDK